MALIFSPILFPLFYIYQVHVQSILSIRLSVASILQY